MYSNSTSPHRSAHASIWLCRGFVVAFYSPSIERSGLGPILNSKRAHKGCQGIQNGPATSTTPISPISASTSITTSISMYVLSESRSELEERARRSAQSVLQYAGVRCIILCARLAALSREQQDKMPASVVKDSRSCRSDLRVNAVWWGSGRGAALPRLPRGGRLTAGLL